MRTEQLTKCSEPLQKLRARFGTRYVYRFKPTSNVKLLTVPWGCFLYGSLFSGVSFCTVSSLVCLDDIYLGLGS